MAVPVAPRRSRRRLIIWSAVGVAAVAIIATGLLLARNGQANGDKNKKNGKGKKEEAAPAAPVELSTVAKGRIETYLETTTVLEAVNSAVLVARRQGQVTALLAEEGQNVKQGQTLARLDDTEAKIAFERARDALDQAERDAKRNQSLLERGVASTAAMDEITLKRKKAKQDLEQAEYDLSHTRITAPFGGKVVTRMINLGETVTPGRECFRVDDFTPLLARVYFPEREQTRVRTGQVADLELDSYPGRTFPARVTIVNPTVDRTNGTFKVTLEVTDREGVLRPGSFARVKLTSGAFDNAVVLPRKAVVSEDGDSFVFVAQGDTVNRVAVRLGAISGDTAQILAGIVPGQKVVTVGQGGLKPGAKIKQVAF
ncbi:MAG: efflux RND transporter periplasmic adaptor subunit [Candidatus Eiseniibacteriota bacterium]